MKIKNIFALAGLSFAGMHLFNKYTSNQLKTLELKEKAPEYTFSWSYGDIAYTKSGIGKPILLIHDLTAASSSYEWHKIIPELSQAHTVYSLDLLGCGNSDKPIINYTNYLYVRLISDFIQKVIKEPCTIVASGVSADIALHLPLQNSDSIQGIVLINPYESGSNYEITRIEQYQSFFLQLPVIGTFVSNYYNSREKLEEKFYQDYFFDTYQIKPEYIDSYYAAYHTGVNTSKALFSSILNHYTYADKEYVLSRLSVPLSLIFGENVSDLENRIQTFSGYEAFPYSTVSSSKQLPQLEQPEQLLDILLSYLNTSHSEKKDL